MESEQEFYSTHSVMTNPGIHTDLFSSAPSELDKLAQWVRNVHFHEIYAKEANLDLPAEAESDPKTSDAAIRFVSKMLDRIIERDSRPLSEERSKDKCFIGTCRDYAVFLCALLRTQGRAARVRCGFALYFEQENGVGIDHWVTEFWDAEENRWRLIDAELDFNLPRHKNIAFNPLDVPRSSFQVAGKAWRLHREGKINAENYGLPMIGIAGEHFIASNVIRDLAALNKLEMLPFDYWGISTKIDQSQSVTDEQHSIIDEVAALTTDGKFNFIGMRKIYKSNDALRVRDPVLSWPKGVEVNYHLELDGS